MIKWPMKITTETTIVIRTLPTLFPTETTIVIRTLPTLFPTCHYVLTHDYVLRRENLEVNGSMVERYHFINLFDLPQVPSKLDNIECIEYTSLRTV
jgi:hypothetical protein